MSAFEITLLFDTYGGMLTEKQQEYLDMRYNQDLSLGEIAENYNITRQGVRDLIKRGELQLKKYEDQCGWCENVLALQSILEGDKSDREKLDIIKQIADKF